MATFSYKLTHLQVDAHFPPTEPIEEQLIEGGTGVYTVSIFGRSIGYYLQVDSGARVNPLRLGQPVRARGRDPEGKPIITEVLETTGTGTPALFKGPYHAALGIGAADATTAPAPAATTVRLATSGDIIYRAFSRPYAGSDAQVINLFASCSYPTGQWQIFFQGAGNGTYQLMERVPGIVNELITYYTASFTTGAGLATPVRSVEITDARGKHVVPVEPLHG
jgi:hypothetical protein